MFFNIVIAPIEIIVEWVFLFCQRYLGAFGIMGAIVGVSLAINFLALPLYNIADSLQEKERQISRKLEPRVKKIKKAFKGDEQFMMLTEYYRQNNYNPIFVLRSSISILIEIPFFIAAYHYLSNNEMLQGASWWIFNNLGAPDEFFRINIGNFVLGIHILPILMTLINFVSGIIYTKGAPMREKMQLYIVALIFLALLYNSPSGLVLYWILNNLFSLVKNIVMKMKNPKRILYISLTFILVCLAGYYDVKGGSFSVKLLVSAVTVVFAGIPLYIKLLSRFVKHDESKKVSKPNFSLFFFSGLALTLLYGFILPSNIIATSAIEFSFLGNTESPLAYVFSSTCIFAGFFLLWPGAIYFMFGDKVKKNLPLIWCVLLIVSMLNCFVFKHAYGNMNASLVLDNPFGLRVWNFKTVILPLFAFALICAAMWTLVKFKKLNYASLLMISICAAELLFGFTNVNKINKEYKAYAKNRQNALVVESAEQMDPMYSLSKDGKNVVFVFLDRAVSSYFPYAFELFPDLDDQFKGFTFYPNTVSFSTVTSLGIPPMLGGYEYTPENMNARSDEMLRDKHNEASLVVPKLFSDAGYKITISDPPWPNYTWQGDLSYYKNFPEMDVFELAGVYQTVFNKEKGLLNLEDMDKVCRKRFVIFSFMESLYPLFRYHFYEITTEAKPVEDFVPNFSALYYLKNITSFDAQGNTFTFIGNTTPHNPAYLDADFEAPANISYDFRKVYKGYDEWDEQHFCSNVAALVQLGKWFDVLRANGCYDNTRIIVVGDHGKSGRSASLDLFSDAADLVDFNTLLLFKDFDSDFKVKIDRAFMTNADSLFMVKEGLGLSDVNPFTGKKFVQEKENGINVYRVYSDAMGAEWNAEILRKRKQFTLLKENGFHVSNDAFKSENWIPLTKWSGAEEGDN